MFLNNPPKYQYLKINDPLLKKTNRAKFLGSGSLKNRIVNSKNISLRDYIGAENFKYELPMSPEEQSRHKFLDGH